MASGGIAELPTPSAQTNGEVDAIAVSGNVAYIGGAFTAVRPAGSPSGSGDVTRNHLAAIDLSTGQLLPWDPGADGDVRALAVSPDGTTVYVGGTFAHLGGAARSRIGSVTSGGAVTSWNPGASSDVRAFAISGPRLYVGGKFTTIGGSARSHLAAFSLATGSLDANWRPNANNWITSLAAAGDGSGRILAGGYFTSLNGDTAQTYLSSLDAATGAPADWQAHPADHVNALAVTATQVFAGEGGPGGKAQGYQEAGGQLDWTAQFDGDVQAIAASGSLVYVGGHFVEYCVGGTGSGAPFVCDTPLSRGKLAAVAQSDGSIDGWNPQTNGSLGVFAMATTANGLAAGGQMTTYGLNLPAAQQVHQQGFARFGPAGSGDSQPPTQPQNLAAAAAGQTSVHLTWDASTDNIGVTGYRIYRDGVAVATIGPATSWDDGGLSPGTGYTYAVTALDAAGNESQASATAQATTDPGTPTTVFADDFEGGSLAKWTHVTGAVKAQSSQVFGGGFAAETTPAGSPAWAYASFSGHTDLTYDLEFKVLSKTSTTIDLAQFRRTTGAVLLTVSLSGSTNRVRVRNVVAKTTVTSTTTAAPGVWHHLVVHLTIAGASGHTDVTLDGAPIGTLSRTWNTGANPIGRVTIGDSTSNRTSDVAYDNVVVHT